MSEEEIEVPPYTEWAPAELREELTNREVEFAPSAQKKKLIKLLEEDDNPATEVDALLKEITKTMGEGVIQLASEAPLATHVPFGSFMLDFALVGGIFEMSGFMVYGYESCGKTTLALLSAAAFQRKYPEGIVAFVDVEKKLDKLWAEKLGVDLSRLLLIRPRSGEAAVDIIESACRSREIVLVILDSIPSLAPMAILEKSAEDKTMMERARLVGLLCSKLQQAWIDEGMRGHKFTFICINQFRDTTGRFSRVLPGGRFQNYMVEFKLDLKSQEVMGTDDGIPFHSHNEHAFTFTKTKGAFSIKSGETVMVMNDRRRTDGLVTGDFDDFVAVCTYAKKFGLITGAGASFYINGLNQGSVKKRFKGLEPLVEFLRGNSDEFMRLKQLLIMIQRRESKLYDIPPDNYLLEPIDPSTAEQYGKVLDEIGYTRHDAQTSTK